MFFEREINDAVIAVLDQTKEIRRQTTRRAAKAAGIHVLDIFEKSIVASYAYGWHSRCTCERNAVIYDFG